MEFADMKVWFQLHFEEMIKDADCLFEVDVDNGELWNLYLDSFPPGTNEIYRERRYYDCSACRHFMHLMGNVVVIKNNVVTGLWDFNPQDETFRPSVEALSAFIKSKPVKDVFVACESAIGVDKNYEITADGNIITWEHFYLKLPRRFVRDRYEADTVRTKYRDTRNVFQRSLEEITPDSVQTVLELIAQNSLYKGEEWQGPLTKFLEYKAGYDLLESDEEKDLYCWEQSVKAGPVIGRMRSLSMGTLLVNLSEGEALDVAVRKYEAIVAPTNYKRPKPIFTQQMLEQAKKTLENLGYMESLPRRFATMDDITVNNILFSNRDAARRLAAKGGITGLNDVFAALKKEAVTNPRQFSRVEKIPIENFIQNVLPTAGELEVYLEGRHERSMVSLIAPAIAGSKTMFKWDNGFSWAYSGNLTDSSLRENVKAAGGSVTGVLRFSIQWNDLDVDKNDLDAHCIEPGGNEIYYRNKRNGKTGGNLDVDIINPKLGVPAVENITWPELSKMDNGSYRFFVRGFSNRGGKKGFRAEIEFNGEIYSFDYGQCVNTGENVDVAIVRLKNGKFTIDPKLPYGSTSREIWGLHSNEFVPVSVVMFSPNYWDGQQGVGHRHYFFMLKNCVNPETPNGFYNEFLKSELMEHRHVLEALGAKLSVENASDQLSGLGFSSTKRDELIVKVKGATERMLKIKF